MKRIIVLSGLKGNDMRAIIAIVSLAACAGCAAPMLTSVDLTQTSQPVLMTYGVGVTDIQLRQLPYGGGEALPEGCKVALDAYDAARSAHDSAAAPYARGVEAIAEVLAFAWNDGEPRRLSALEKKAIIGDLKTLSAEGDALVTLADKARLAERAVVERCPSEQPRIEATAHVRPAPDLIYGMTLSGGQMSNDALKVVTGVDGLPTSITASADDQTGAATVAAAQLIGRFAASDLGVSPMPWDPNDLLGFLGDDGMPAVGGDRFVGSETAADRCGIAAMPARRRLVEMERRPACADAGSLVQLAIDLLPEPDTFEARRPETAERPIRRTLAELEAGTIYAGAQVRAVCATPIGRPREEIENGVVVATPTPCELRIADANGVELGRLPFLGLRASHLTVVQVDRAALVKNSTTLTFQNGVVTTADVSRPSSGAALVGLPGQFINGLVTGVTDAFRDSQAIETARVNHMTAETNRLNAEAARITQPTPAWTEADTAYVQAQGVVATRQATYDAALAAEEPDPAAIATAAAELRNAKALANAAAVAANRPLPYPDLI